MIQAAPEGPAANPPAPEAEPASLPGANPTTEDPFQRHDIYFFKDGNVTFLVRGLCFLGFVYPTRLTDNAAGRWYTLLCPSVLFRPRLGLLLLQIFPARHP